MMGTCNTVGKEHSDWLMHGTRIRSGFLLSSFSTRFYVKGSRVYAALDHVVVVVVVRGVVVVCATHSTKGLSSVLLI